MSLVASLRRFRRRLLVHRRGLAALLAALAVLLVVRATTAPPPALQPLLVAADDLPGGTVLAAGDLRTAQVPADAVPQGAVQEVEAAGRVLAAPLRSGEPVTDVRLVAPGLLVGYPGAVLAPVRVADAGAVALLGVGDVVDVVATSPESGEAEVVARGVPVVALPRESGSSMGLEGTGRLVVLAVDAPTAIALAEGSVASVLSVVLT
jgi:Flp pilus assembly protein CpaB